MNERFAREIEFHEDRFADGHGARPQDRFYVAVDAAMKLVDTKVRRCAAAGGKGLEVGCATGVWLAELLDAATFTACGIDISPAAIETASRRFAGARQMPDLHVMDGNRLTFEDQSFDFVYGSGVVHHLEIPRSLEEAHRVLRVGGRFVFLEPLGTNPFIALYRRATPADRSPDETPLTAAHLAQIQAIFGGAEFTYFGFFTLLALPLWRWTRAQRAVIAVTSTLDKIVFKVPGLWRFAWMVVIDARKHR